MKAIVFSLLMYVALAFGGTSGFPLELMEAADIRDIERLDYEVVRLSAKIKQCAAAGPRSGNRVSLFLSR